MAFTQGINGTFGPIVYIDAEEEVPFSKMKKTVPDGNNGWEEKVFYSTTKDSKNAAIWLQEKYGKPTYCISWWQVGNRVIMSEKIYTHYALSV